MTMLAREVSVLLTGMEVPHGHLVEHDGFPSRNLFLTDRGQVFVKVTVKNPEHEVATARLARDLGVETPEPFGFAALPDGRFISAWQYMEASGPPVSSTELVSAVSALWGLGVTDRRSSWADIAQRSERNLAAIEGSPQANEVTSLLRSAVMEVVSSVEVFGEPEPVFTHGDAHYRNAMRVDGGVVLIDWEWAGMWWPELEVGKFIQACLSEPDPGNDGAIDGVISIAESALGRTFNADLLAACVRLRAANALAYQVRWGVVEARPDWFERGLELAREFRI